jgi:hypothetical protein
MASSIIEQQLLVNITQYKQMLENEIKYIKSKDEESGNLRTDIKKALLSGMDKIKDIFLKYETTGECPK